MFENLSKPIKEDEEPDKRSKTSITERLQSLETLSNDIFLSLKKKKPHSYEISSRLLWMLVIFLMNYKTNFMILEKIRPHVMFFRKGLSLSSGVLCANPTRNRVTLSWGQILKYPFL